ncbi:MAG: tetratricopeptide repeat protein, partial [Oscillospiraceae bacterium]
KEAVDWYTKAAELGNAIAMCNLGVCYKYGTGVKKDEKKAVEWYT